MKMIPRMGTSVTRLQNDFTRDDFVSTTTNQRERVGKAAQWRPKMSWVQPLHSTHLVILEDMYGVI